METLQTVLLVVQVLIAISVIGLILIQHGKGADAGAAFGSGASSTVFGSQGSGNFLSKMTAVLAAIFLSNSLALAYVASERMKESGSSLMEEPTAIVQTVDEQPSSPELDYMPPLPVSDIPLIPE
jgi:preprotein translocase subunit SecG